LFEEKEVLYIQDSLRITLIYNSNYATNTR